MTLSCWQLTEFNLEGQLTLGQFGLVRICRSDAGILMLVTDDSFGLRDHQQPAPMQIAPTDSILGFILDIGIQRTKALTNGSGYFFDKPLLSAQSPRRISQQLFDAAEFQRIANTMNGHFQSRNVSKITHAIRCKHLMDTYNNARLLFPNFYSESYLSLLRILDAVLESRGRYHFAVSAALLSQPLNTRIYESLCAVDGYKHRLAKAIEFFHKSLAKVKGKFHKDMLTLDDAGRVIFACFVSAYQYRNKFMHAGFPIPDIVKDSMGFEQDLGTAYLNPVGPSFQLTMYRPDGVKYEDMIELHQVLDPTEIQEFQETLFPLLPTWYFAKHFAREALLRKL